MPAALIALASTLAAPIEAAAADAGASAPAVADTGTASSGAALEARLERLSRSLERFSARFVQTSYDADSRPLATSRGEMALARPGRFYWRVQTPEPQEIVADGRHVWVYDIPLDQVTVTALDERLSGSPLLLLTTDTPLAETFEVTALGAADGLDWLELLPREGDSDFEAVYLGLGQGEQGTLAAMELRDGFGRATQLRFEDVDTDPPDLAARFRFDPPPGVDVIGSAD